MTVAAKLSRGVLVRSASNPNRYTLTVTYQLGEFRRTLSVRCYVAGTASKFPGLVEITINGTSATLCPRLAFRDANEKVVSHTEYYWTIPVLECAAAAAPAQISRAAMELALGK